MRFKKLFPLIVDTNIEVQTRGGETMLNGDPAAMTWDSIEEIKNREILEIVACANKNEDVVMLITIKDE
ncbi:hypothetical protein [Acidaminococcus timonensis]|uniref:hypothetical protein n=1 Tax=Acidaminococcus timonensis TaxID=1871002 RepID=UPI0008D9BBBE|nr:hypothetical protein [Acidaminococcus timonensis]